jgi:hypothetical protein
MKDTDKWHRTMAKRKKRKDAHRDFVQLCLPLLIWNERRRAKHSVKSHTTLRKGMKGKGTGSRVSVLVRVRVRGKG